jgi:hypothetical protein
MPKDIDSTRRAVRGVTFDTGALIAIERRKAGALALVKACRRSRARITIPSVVVAEWWRGTHAGILEIGHLEGMTPRLAMQAGDLLVRTRRANAIDAIVVASAAQRGDLIVTSDLDDIRELARATAGVDVVSVE